MKKLETLSRGEELLAQVLDECLEEDLSFVPPEREIARNHQFSEHFEETLRALLEANRQGHQEAIRKHFSPRWGQWAACVLLFCVCSGLFYYVTGPAMDKEVMTGSTTDTAFGKAEGAEMEEAAPEEAPAAAEAESAASEAGAQIPDQQKIYCGQVVSLAEQQDVPETLDYVTTLVNCPVLDEENPVLYLTIGNIGEEDIQYLNRYDLEVWMDGGWYLIPMQADWQEEWLTLEAGMAVDDEINLLDYQIDFDAQQYRLITYVGEDLISAEFTFTEVFTETMEQLEGEDSSGE